MTKYKIPNEQQLFLLSRFFNIPEENIKDMPVHRFMPLMEEMNKYLETQYSRLSKKGDVPLIEEMDECLKDSTNTNRFELLDL